jgi:hypothetical protein
MKGSAAEAFKAVVSQPEQPEPTMTWLEMATELRRANDAFEAQRKAEADAEPQPQAETPAQMLARALRGQQLDGHQAVDAIGPAAMPLHPAESTATLPLNGVALLHQMVGGPGNYTINGESA